MAQTVQQVDHTALWPSGSSPSCLPQLFSKWDYTLYTSLHSTAVYSAQSFLIPFVKGAHGKMRTLPCKILAVSETQCLQTGPTQEPGTFESNTSLDSYGSLRSGGKPKTKGSERPCHPPACKKDNTTYSVVLYIYILIIYIYIYTLIHCASTWAVAWRKFLAWRSSPCTSNTLVLASSAPQGPVRACPVPVGASGLKSLRWSWSMIWCNSLREVLHGVHLLHRPICSVGVLALWWFVCFGASSLA